MAIQPILKIGHPQLRLLSKEVDFSREDVSSMVRDLQDTLRHFQNEKKIGRAIAGPQIGLLKRIILMETPGRTLIMINPVIKEKSGETFEVWDSCFSADVAFFGMTRRHRKIRVEYLDREGQPVTESFADDLSELFQHEIDHLEGILFTDRIIDNRIIMREEWEKL